MALYPSLEDMKIDQMMKVQQQTESFNPIPSAPSSTYDNSLHQLYPSLGDYMGLDLSENAVATNMPEYAVTVRPQTTVGVPTQYGALSNMIAPLSGESVGLKRAQVTNGIRELTLCKDTNGKLGLRVQSINNGVFVCLVGQHAAACGLRFGDQILSINDEYVAGYTMQQVHKILSNAKNDIKVVIRDRPFDRTITMHKDSLGHIGFQFKNGKIISLVKDSSAARNGLLIDHQILEINGKNVVGLKDKDITKEIANGGNVITVTVIPSYIYDHMIKKMNNSLLKTMMDHSVLEI